MTSNQTDCLTYAVDTEKSKHKVPLSLACSDKMDNQELGDRTGQRLQHQSTDTYDCQYPSDMHHDDLHELTIMVDMEGLESPCLLDILHPVYMAVAFYHHNILKTILCKYKTTRQ